MSETAEVVISFVLPFFPIMHIPSLGTDLVAVASSRL